MLLDNTTSKKTLTIYKASAGSGKTFRLAVEYIKLLIANPRAYEGILGVTFTNKATEEMKMRILSQLYGIWKELPDSAAYLSEVTSSLNITPLQASEKAGVALHMLLHNYHFFRIQTIDAFFQSVLRNLAKELQLNAGLSVGLNTKEVISQAVDAVIESTITDMNVHSIIMKYIHEKMDDNKHWNITGDLKKFGENIFQETYKQQRRNMDAAFLSPTFFGAYKQTLCNLEKDITNYYVETGKETLEKMEVNGFSCEDFYYNKTGPIGYFIKLSTNRFNEDKLLNNRVVEAMANPEKWAGKNSKKRNEVIAYATENLIPLYNKLEATRNIDIKIYNTIKLTLGLLNNVMLLRHIEAAAHNLNQAAQRFMLNDTQSFLHDMIGEGDAPFIFEKIGAHLAHIMIDEFQDTSTVQWSNFKPLLHECMSAGNTNLIVGDVKQSIYRFRNGDWRLLNNIDSEFPPTDLEFPPIRTNRRSDMNIIMFNNCFFSILAKIEADAIREYSEDRALELEKAYADVEQLVPDGKQPIGMVRMEFLPQEQMEQMEERTLQIINELMEKGADPSDIAILLRENKHINSLATFLESASNGTFKIVSEEAFKLNASAAVRIIVNAMTFLVNPHDSIALIALAADYCHSVLGTPDILDDAIAEDRPLTELLPEEFLKNKQSLSTLSLHDMAESIIRFFNLESKTEEGAYITAFFDILSDFTANSSTIAEEFIKAWNDELKEKSIQTTSGGGIRLMTIHKSKGLEFKHVIIPYCNWKLESSSKSTIIWSKPATAPFNELPLVPLAYHDVKSFDNSLYETDGYEEHIQRIVDDLNILYVAMTRAGHSLFIIGERHADDKNKGACSYRMCQALRYMPEKYNDVDIRITGMNNEEEPLCLSYGNFQQGKAKHHSMSKNVFSQQAEPIKVNVTSHANGAEYKQSSESRRFANDNTDEADRNRMIKLGTIMHQLFANIRTLADIESAINRMELDGALCSIDFTHDELLESINSKFQNATVCQWFSDEWTVYNECSILSPDGTTHRPDRVITNGTETIVIDFKFGMPHKEHHRQVKEYMELLKEMNMPGVCGALWYVSNNEIVDIYS